MRVVDDYSYSVKQLLPPYAMPPWSYDLNASLILPSASDAGRVRAQQIRPTMAAGFV
jgi:hypothetical protein